MKAYLISGKFELQRRPQCLWLAGCLLVAPAAALGGATDDAPDIRRDATVIAVERVMPTVVNIATKSIVPVSDPMERAYREFWHQKPFNEYYSLGSGVVIDEAGYLLTNEHVVRGANQIWARFGTGTNDYQATLVAKDRIMDVALLKLNGRPGERFRAIKLAREDDLLLGETVLALGNPFGLGGSVTRGILSSKSRRVPKEGQPLDIPNWLQTDAPINRGNSGGPLVNVRGELIGINVAVLNEDPSGSGQPVQGIGFAIPIRLVEEGLSDSFPTEFVRSYWFGARVKVGSYPLVITSVQPESPAGRAGLKAGDAVLQVNGELPNSFIDFGELLSTNAGSDISISIRRGGNTSSVTIRLAPEKSVFNAAMVREKLGLSLDRTVDGFVISEVQPSSAAAAAGLQKGMLIRAVDGDAPPADTTGLAKLLYAKKKGEAVLLHIAVMERSGNFNILRQGNVELVPR